MVGVGSRAAHDCTQRRNTARHDHRSL